MRTVVAVTAPVEAAGPNALTQSPTARLVAAAAWRRGHRGAAGGRDLELLASWAWQASWPSSSMDFAVLPKLPGETSKPVTDRVDPLTAVTFPLAMAMLARPENPEPRLDLELNVGRVPPVVPLSPLRRKKPPPPPPPPGPPAPAPPPVVPAPRPNAPVHDPLDEAVVTVMLRAAMVVFDDFEGVPVTVTQSPAVERAHGLRHGLGEGRRGRPADRRLPSAGVLHLHGRAGDARRHSRWHRGFDGVVAAPAADPSVVAATSATAPAPT